MKACWALVGLLMTGVCLPGAAQSRLAPPIRAELLASEYARPVQLTTVVVAPSNLLGASLRSVITEQKSGFSSERSVSLTELAGGRLVLAGFDRHVSMRNVSHGLPDSTLVRHLSVGTLGPQADNLYGLRLSFNFSQSSEPHGHGLGACAKAFVAALH